MAAAIQVTISAVDQATATINRVNAQIEGLHKRVNAAFAPVQRVGQALGRFGDVSGINRVAGATRDLARAGLQAAERFGRFAPALSALTGAASVAGLARMVQGFGEFGAKLGNASDRIGIAADRLHGLGNAARLGGSSAEAMTSGLTTLQDTIVAAIHGRAPEAVVFFNSLGISLRNADGSARSATEVFPEVAAQVARMGNASTQAYAATKAFGSAGEQLLPVLRRGASGLAEYEAQARRYGTVNERGVEAARRMQEAQARLSMAVEGVGYAVAERLAPVLVPMLDRLSEWVVAHKDQIAAFFERVAQLIERWVNNGGIEDLVARLGRFATTVDSIATSLGGWVNVTETLFGLWIGSKFLGVLANLGRLGTAVATVGGGMGGIATAIAVIAKVGSDNETPENRAALEQTNRERRRDAMLEGPQDGFGVDGLPVTPGANRSEQDDYIERQARAIARLMQGVGPGAGEGPRDTGGGTATRSGTTGEVTPGEAARAGAAPTYNAAGMTRSKAEFVERYRGKAEEAERRTGTAAEFWLAQWGIETGWGSHIRGNNIGNIRALPGEASMRRFDPNSPDDRAHGGGNYRVFDTPEAGAQAATDLVMRSRRYQGALNQGRDFDAAGRGMAPWAEDPNYARNLAATARGIQLPPRPAAPAMAAPMAPAPAPAAAAAQNGSIQVDVNHTNAPAGAQATVRLQGGGLQAGDLRVQRAMPDLQMAGP